MPEIEIVPGDAGLVGAIARRRQSDEATLRLSLSAVDRAEAWIARDGGEAIGIALASGSNDERYVGDLFVEPSYRGQGIGNALLGAALSAGSGNLVLLDPADPAALAMVLRRGFRLFEPVVRVAGTIPREEAVAKMAAGQYRFDVAPIDAAVHIFALRELDRRTRGIARDEAHAEFARRATGNAFFLNGECVGFAYVWPDGRIGPFACASPAYLVQILAYALITLVRAYRASWCTLLIPGSNARIARASLRAGLQIVRTLALAGDGPPLDLSAYSGYHELEF